MARIAFGGLTSTAVTANQTVLTDTPTNAESLKTILISGYLTTYSATESNMGVVILRQNGVDKAEFRIQNTDLDSVAGVVVIPVGDGLLFNGTDPIAVVVTPAAVTSMRWTASFFYQ
jgi:hypothetical protein